MKKVYVVRYGSYSDQGIAGVFSTEEKAEKFCEIKNQLTEDIFYTPFWIDEYELDKKEYKKDVKLVTYYHAWIDTEDGELYEDDNETAIYSKDVIVEIGDCYVDVKSVKGLEHAKKVAIEKYQIITQNKLESPEVTTNED